MRSKTIRLLAFLLVITTGSARAAKDSSPPVKELPPSPLVFRELRYAGKVSDEEARFGVEVTVETQTKQEVSGLLFEGDLALVPPRLPAPLRIERTGNQYRLYVTKPGTYQFRVEAVAKITRAEPWSQMSFKGPAAVIAAVSAQATGGDVELQLLSGTLVESAQTNGLARVQGFLGGDQTVELRWSRAGGQGEAARQAVATVETTATVQITPTVVKYVTALHYEIIQGKLSKLTVALPAAQALTRLVGEQVRNWEINPGPSASGGKEVQLLTVEFIKPLEKEYQLTLHSEQPVESMPATAALVPPQPLAVERESGSLTIATEDTLADIESAAGLRQVNAPSGSLAAYRFNGRPLAVALKLQRIQPVVKVTQRVGARVEETRLLAACALTLEVEKAGIYALELLPPAALAVADVRGEGVEDWKVSDAPAGGGKILRVNFANRVLGVRKLEVQLEQPLKTFPEQLSVAPLRVVGAAQESAQIGAASAAGIRLKTVEMDGLREIPASKLAGRTDELLAYTADQPDWKLTLGTERLAARVVADIFNLVTIGDGIVGGSATIRYGLINQGVQQFELSLPAEWKNVEFTGPNIRRKDQKEGGRWTIGLQDKAWGGYTLVVTYDFQFDPKGAKLPVGGIHAVGVERETGSVALTTAASLKLNANSLSGALRRVDEAELAPADRALITRAVLLAGQYSDPNYNLTVEVKRFDELPVLSAVADRTQLTTVLTDAGELLTQASFMVKNNDKQFQKFKLPPGANFWSCYVNGQPVKAERDREWLMVPLLRGANRDQAFAVDIVYAEKKALTASLLSGAFQLEAPQTDVPNTYAEWQLYAPALFHLSGFGGNMTVARGTTYDLRDAWQQFVAVYRDLLYEAGPGLFLIGVLVVLVVALIASAVRRGWNGVFAVLGVFCITALLAAMLLPALARSKARAQRINAVNSLKQIGLAAKTFALDNDDRLPASFAEMMNELGTEKILIDPESGQQFVYVGGGLKQESISPESVLAFSPTDTGGYRAVLLADGSVQQMPSDKFAELSRRGFIVPATTDQIARNQQATAVRDKQFQPARTETAAGSAVVKPSAFSGLPGGGGGAGVGRQAESAAPAAAAPAPMVAGLRAIRIEIPRTGQSFVFTKVLNVGREPLSVRAKLMKLRTFQTAQMVVQLTLFLAGLLVWWWQWRRGRNSFVLALALALMFASIGSLLLAWRLLHVGLVILAPLLALAALGWVTWRYWPRKAPGLSAGPAPVLPPEIPPAVAAIALLLFASGATATAARAPKANARPVAAESQQPESAVSVIAAVYSGTVNDRIAQLDATIQVSAARAGEKIKLFGDDVVVERFSSKPAEARLLREGNAVAVLLPRRGDTTLQLKLLIKLGGDVSRRQLGFAIPPALTSQVAVAIDQPEADVEFPTAVSFKRLTTNQQTRVEAIMGSGERVDLRWTPRVKHAAEIAANVICQNATLVSFGNGVANARATLDYQVTQGEMRQARVRLPAGHRLLRVEGEAIRTWEIKKENSEDILTVELLKGVAPSYKLTVETETLLPALPALVKTGIPHALGVKRETGLVAVCGEEELDLTVEHTEDLYRVDADEFARVTGQKTAGTLNVFRFLKPDFTLAARVAATQPQIEAVVRNRLGVSPEQVSLTAAIDYTIKRAGVFALKVALPPGYRVETVAGNNILQWTERKETQPPTVEVTFKERTSGAYALRLELVQNLKELPHTLPLGGVHPLGALKLAGFVSVSAEPGVALKPDTFEGLTEIPVAAIPGNDSAASGSVLAYKFIAGESQLAAPWKLSVVTETVESWVRAEIVNTLTLSDALVSGRALARYEIQNVPVKELRLKIPAAFRNVEVSGANIRRREHGGELWRVEFQNKIHGPHILTVTWEQPRLEGTNHLELAGVAADGVERETGILAIVARPPLQVTEQRAVDLKPIDTRDLPEWAGRPDDATVLAYRYVRPGYTLALEAKRFDEAEVLQALVENVTLTTVVADDGQMMTEMSLAVRNNGRQHLEVALPAGATVWSAFVAGQPVRPSVREGRLLLPLERSDGAGDAPVTVELTYVGSGTFPQTRGAVELVSPLLDVPLKSARWDLFLPPDYRYSDFGGTMAREGAAAAEAASFSVFDYSKREWEAKAGLAKALKLELGNAKRNLSVGNVREAYADYNRAKAKGSLAEAKDAETQKLEESLRRAQGSNLILAQNAFSLNNGGQTLEQQQLPSANATIQYDASAAEAQWTKLQQAQELGAAKVQPIRVNLPTRGLRHSFTQVLQTESSKPMTIRLLASSTKVISWPKRLGTGLGGFLGLWLVVALLSRLAPQPRQV